MVQARWCKPGGASLVLQAGGANPVARACVMQTQLRKPGGENPTAQDWWRKRAWCKPGGTSMHNASPVAQARWCKHAWCKPGGANARASVAYDALRPLTR
eukprot:358512-Chlamydomonas_euryale.AAC.4